MLSKSLSKAERTRLMIIERSAELFNQKGFAGTSMSDIMEVTGLTKGGLYGNFKSKEDIAVAAFEFAVAEITHRVGARTRVIDDPLDKLKAVVYFYKEHLFNPPIKGGCPILNTAVESDDTSQPLREKVMQATDVWEHNIARTLRKGIERGQIRPDTDPAEFATLFIGMLEGAILLARIYRDVGRFNVITRRLLDLIEALKA